MFVKDKIPKISSLFFFCFVFFVKISLEMENTLEKKLLNFITKSKNQTEEI